MGLNFFGIGEIDANYGKNTKLSFSGWGQVNGLSFIPSIKELKRRGLKENEIYFESMYQSIHSSK